MAKVMVRVAPPTKGEEPMAVNERPKVMLRTAGSGDPEPPAPPQGYKPLTPQQRKDWNDFLDYLEKEKVGGSPELDKRDQSLGFQYLDRYKKMNPNSSVSKDIIPSVQYEQYMLRKGKEFPGLKPEELDYIRKGLNPAYLNKPVSGVDSWLGSLTSRQYYPNARRGTNQGEQYDFGVNFEDFVRSINDSALQEKYRVKR